MKKIHLVWIAALFIIFPHQLFTLDTSSSCVMQAIYLAGPEFGNRDPAFCNENPGKPGVDYWFNSEKSFAYFTAKGCKVFRIPLMWERLQRTLSGPLDENYMAGIRQNITWAKQYGASIVLDIMNQCRYSLKRNGLVYKAVIDDTPDIEAPVTEGDIIDLWKRLSSELKNEQAVYAYGLMNEPHDLKPFVWKRVSQSLVTAIRKNGDSKPIFINGDGWSTCDGWLKYNPEPWITDSSRNFIYEASCFLDSNGSGSYLLSFDDERARDPKLAQRGDARTAPFIAWCKKYDVRGYISSAGVPRDDARWLFLLDRLLSDAENKGIGWSYWAGGEWWKQYALSVQPANSYKTDSPQMNVLTRHFSGKR